MKKPFFIILALFISAPSLALGAFSVPPLPSIRSWSEIINQQGGYSGQAYSFDKASGSPNVAESPASNEFIIASGELPAALPPENATAPSSSKEDVLEKLKEKAEKAVINSRAREAKRERKKQKSITLSDVRQATPRIILSGKNKENKIVNDFGSGIVIDSTLVSNTSSQKKYTILTAGHVINPTDLTGPFTIRVEFPDGTIVNAKVKKSDQANTSNKNIDLGLLEIITTADIPVIPIAKSMPPGSNSKVTQVGYPGGRKKPDNNPFAYETTIITQRPGNGSGTIIMYDPKQSIVCNKASESGMSGGPLLSKNKDETNFQVIGICSASDNADSRVQETIFTTLENIQNFISSP